MKLLYIISKFLTFPGAYLKGFWEHIMCRISKVTVEPTGYVRADEACGHAEHALFRKPFGALMVSTFPGFINFCMGINFFFLGFMNLNYMGITWYDSKVLFIVYIVSLYLGVSMLSNVFPLTEDILNYWEMAFSKNKIKKSGIKRAFQLIGRVLVFIPTLITRLGAFLEKNCITFIALIAFIIYSFVF